MITNGQGVAVVDSAPPAPGRRSFATRPEFRAALRGDVATGTRHSSTLGYDLLYVAVPVASGGTVHGAVRITYPTSELDRRVRNYWLVLAGIAVVVLAAAALIGLSFARWIRRPLAGLEVAAAEAGAGDLSARAPVPDAPPELRRLALEFNDMVARVDGLVSVQQEFVADASHELRTPLTALRLRLENLERHVGDDGRASLDAAAAEVERLSGLVDELLALARADAGTAPAETVDLAAWPPRGSTRGGRPPARCASSSSAPGPVERAGRPRPGRAGDRQPRLERAAARARRAPSITVSVARRRGARRASRRRRGPGDDGRAEGARLRPLLARRLGPGGSGLGLAIVRRLVEVDGGTIELRDAPGGASRRVVRPAGRLTRRWRRTAPPVPVLYSVPVPRALTEIRLPVGFAGVDPPPRWPRPRSAPRPEALEAGVETLPRVGPAVRGRLAKLGLRTVGDLLAPPAAPLRAADRRAGDPRSSSARRRP